MFNLSSKLCKTPCPRDRGWKPILLWFLRASLSLSAFYKSYTLSYFILTVILHLGDKEVRVLAAVPPRLCSSESGPHVLHVYPQVCPEVRRVGVRWTVGRSGTVRDGPAVPTAHDQV